MKERQETPGALQRPWNAVKNWIYEELLCPALVPVVRPHVPHEIVRRVGAILQERADRSGVPACRVLVALTGVGLALTALAVVRLARRESLWPRPEPRTLAVNEGAQRVTPYRVSYPDGVQVELLGVRVAGSGWVSPDGTRTIATPYPTSARLAAPFGVASHGPAGPTQVALQVQGVSPDASLFYNATGGGAARLPGAPARFHILRWDSEDSPHSRLRVGIATGDWKDTGPRVEIGASRQRVRGVGSPDESGTWHGLDVVYQGASPLPGGRRELRFGSRAALDGWQVRLLVEGKRGQSQVLGVFHDRIPDALTLGEGISRAATSVRFQARPVRWMTFANLAFETPQRDSDLATLVPIGDILQTGERTDGNAGG